jgi:hypothetical protein
MVEGYASLAKKAQDAKVWEVGIRNIVGGLFARRVNLPKADDRCRRSMLSGEGGDFSLGNAMNRRRSAMVPSLSFARSSLRFPFSPKPYR